MNIHDLPILGCAFYATPARHKYTTHHQYGVWPAGTEVIAYRALRTDELCLEFPDGVTVVLHPGRHLEGIEPVRPRYLAPLEPGEPLCS